MRRFAHTMPALAVLLPAAALLIHGPVAQLSHYHAFADQSAFLGMPHAGDVLSNAGFAVVALAGLWRIAPAGTSLRGGWPGYLLFLAALLMTAAGSAWYHLAPDNARLLWDRLPIALACAGLLAGVRGDTVPGGGGLRDTVVLSLCAVASVAWWRVTDLLGHGDLGPYLLLQALPLLLVPLWQWIHRAPRADRLAFGAALLLYVLAKVAELHDYELLATLHVASGHTLKHLLATLAAAMIVARLAARPATTR
jgi:hypothetical protein